jgi:AcrR family transcriptional regulator
VTCSCMLPLTSASCINEPHESDLRTRHKRRTRRALFDAALKLFAEQGYENTTIAQIAATAEVGERTFFAHFRSKENVLFSGDHRELDDFDLVVAGASPELSDLGAVAWAFLHVMEREELVAGHAMTRLLLKAEGSSSVVRASRVEHMMRIVSSTRIGLAKRHGEEGPSAVTDTVAGIAGTLLTLAINKWTVALPEDIDQLVLDQFDLARVAAADSRRI